MDDRKNLEQGNLLPQDCPGAENGALRAIWKDSVYSDGSPLYVSNLSPSIGELVTIRLRMLAGAPVCRVFLRYITDGSQRLKQMFPQETVNDLTYYAAELPMTQKKLKYQFYLTGTKTASGMDGDDLPDVFDEKDQKETIIFCYTQKGITPYLQDETYDFTILSDYIRPDWVRSAVFYQIFPDRFCNGDPDNDVKDGEIVLEGHSSRQVRDWNTVPVRYEQGFCMDFYGGDLEGIRQKIPYLKELGITALYLNPIFLAPTTHKYDCIDYEHVDPHFGGDRALQELSEALHAEGMHLVLDISVNHTGTDHKWFNKDGTYFDKRVGAYNNPDSAEREFYFFDDANHYKGWLDHPNMPEMNYQSQALRERIYLDEDSILKKWLKLPYQIDGWRFDVADVMAKYGPVQIEHEVWREIRREIKKVNPQAYILAEEWTDCSEYLQGEEWDGTMDYYGCARIWRPFIGMTDPFLDESGILAGIKSRLSAEAVKMRLLSFFGRLPFAIRQNLFNLLDSHDVNRLHRNEGLNMREYRGAVIAQFTMIGVPSLYYGDEAGIDAYTDSLEGCRYPMPWDSGFEQSEQYDLYHTLIRLRREHPVFSEGSFQILYAKGQVIVFARQDAKECWISIISSGRTDEWILLPVGLLGVREIEKQDALGSTLISENIENGFLKILVKAHESYLFEIR